MSSSTAAMRSAFAASHRLTMTAPTVWFPAATRARTGERIGSIVWTRIGVKGTSASLQDYRGQVGDGVGARVAHPVLDGVGALGLGGAQPDPRA